MNATTKLIADVAPEVKQKLIELKQPGETIKDVIVRLIEKEHKSKCKK